MADDDSQHVEQLYINSEWRDSGDTISVHGLADGGTVATVAAASSHHANEALAAAAEAQDAMRETTPVERADWLEAIDDEIDTVG